MFHASSKLVPFHPQRKRERQKKAKKNRGEKEEAKNTRKRTEKRERRAKGNEKSKQKGERANQFDFMCTKFATSWHALKWQLSTPERLMWHISMAFHACHLVYLLRPKAFTCKKKTRERGRKEERKKRERRDERRQRGGRREGKEKRERRENKHVSTKKVLAPWFKDLNRFDRSCHWQTYMPAAATLVMVAGDD